LGDGMRDGKVEMYHGDELRVVTHP
jgi:hypothetical protein